MIRINLLPYRAARKKENIRIQVNVFLGSVFIVILLVVWANALLGGKIEDLNSEITSTREQVAKYKKINQEIAEIKKKLEVLDRKIKVIESLQAGRKAQVQNLDSLYQLLVEKRMWYNQIEERGDRFSLKGIALDNHTVADFMTRVEKSDRFQNVRLSTIRQYELKGKDLKLKQFEVNFQSKSEAQDTTGGKK
ncbi:MAG: PilN domain-containing protein [Desulfobacteraceae bacterium]|jgi:type IV pilus assembly protein PilN